MTPRGRTLTRAARRQLQGMVARCVLSPLRRTPAGTRTVPLRRGVGLLTLPADATADRITLTPKRGRAIVLTFRSPSAAAQCGWESDLSTEVPRRH